MKHDKEITLGQIIACLPALPKGKYGWRYKEYKKTIRLYGSYHPDSRVLHGGLGFQFYVTVYRALGEGYIAEKYHPFLEWTITVTSSLDAYNKIARDLTSTLFDDFDLVARRLVSMCV